jgi:acetylornithine/succinyldiaminopimelate/putrescine aminotransferase
MLGIVNALQMLCEAATFINQFPTRPAGGTGCLLTVSSDHVGARESIRFLPALNVKADEVDQALSIVEQACADVFD